MLLSTLAALWLNTGLAAPSPSLAPSAEQLFQLQQDSSANAMLVQFANPEVARLAAISLHDALLGGRWQDSRLIVQLDAAAQARLAPFALSMTPAYLWQQQQAVPQPVPQNATSIPGFECYPTVEETYSQAEQLVRDYPNYVRWQKIGSGWAQTQYGNGYDLYVLVISDASHGRADKAKLLINSAIHAREYATAAFALEFAKDILSKAGNDADVDWMLQRNEIHLVLQTNPEGRKIAETGVFWRKNINDRSCSTGNYGVDLNRNFSFGWFSISNGSSANSCDLTYRGVAAGSEPEVQALQNYARSLYPDQRGPARTDAAPDTTAGIHIDLHSFSELVLWPWGDTKTPAPNGPALKALGHKLAWFNNYAPMQAIGLYPTDGTSDGVSYGELGVAAFTIEMGTAFFEPCSNYQANILPDNLRALYYALRVNTAPYLLPAGPDLTQISLNTVSGSIARNVPLKLTALATDSQSSGYNGGVASQPIQQVEVTLDQWPDDAAANPMALIATDGQFDSATEAVSYQQALTGLSEGRHVLYLRAKDSAGNTGPVYARYFQITPAETATPPQPEFSVECQFLQCQFRNTTVFDASLAVAFNWSFTSTDSSTAANPQFSYPAPGRYQAKLTATLAGQIAERQRDVQVYAEPQLTLGSTCQGLSCTLTATASSANGSVGPAQWTVNNQTLSGNSIQLTFAAGGSYQASAEVTDSAGQKAQKQLTITVTAPAVTEPARPASGQSSGGGLGFSAWLMLLLVWCRRARVYRWRRQ